MIEASQESWVRTTCYMCYSCCGIRVKVESGRATQIEGDPDHPHNRGKLCAKGRAGLASLYDPHRVTFPLRRTNPQKGIGIDPGWQAITWEEALEILTDKLKRIKQEDSRKLVVGGLDFHFSFILYWFGSAFGTPNIWKGGADYYCGNGLHPITYLTLGTFFAEPDLDHCNYCLLIGSQLGFMVNTNAVTMTMKMAEARARGMKVVVVDPIGTNAAAKADEWIPIRPGTDSALVLAIINLLLNELGIYDQEFLKRHTNAPYLVAPDGLYVRDSAGKPLLWDSSQGQAIPYDSPGANAPALEGAFCLGGRECWPAFQVLKNHVAKYSPRVVEEITGVPAETIQRVAQEFGQAAKVGSTLVKQDKELPYRPVAVTWNKGIAHNSCMMIGQAIQTLNMLVGAVDVPGGLLGTNAVGPGWQPKLGPDGMLVPADLHLILEPAFPARPVERPRTLELRELFPVASYSSPLFEEAMLHPEKYGLEYQPELLLLTHSNVMMSTSQPGRMAEVLKKFSFVVVFNLQLDETAEFADLVLPDAHYLERMVAFPNRPNEYLAAGEGCWHWLLAQPPVRPVGQARPWPEVLLELAHRLKILPDFLAIFNSMRGLKEPFKLHPDKKYSWEEIVDTWAKSWFGPERDLDWFKKHSLLITREKSVEEAFPRPFLKARIPIYAEHFLSAGKEVERVTREMGLAWEVANYQALPDWRPCSCYHEGSGMKEFDLVAVNYKLPFHTFSATVQNSLLDELAQHHPWAYKILLHSEVAKSKGIQEGDTIWVKSRGGKVKGTAKPTECIHPEVVGIAGTFGHWAAGMPVAKDKGAHFNSLIPWEMESIDPVSAALDGCARVKVYKA